MRKKSVLSLCVCVFLPLCSVQPSALSSSFCFGAVPPLPGNARRRRVEDLALRYCSEYGWSHSLLPNNLFTTFFTAHVKSSSLCTLIHVAWTQAEMQGFYGTFKIVYLNVWTYENWFSKSDVNSRSLLPFCPERFEMLSICYTNAMRYLQLSKWNNRLQKICVLCSKGNLCDVVLHCNKHILQYSSGCPHAKTNRKCLM